MISKAEKILLRFILKYVKISEQNINVIISTISMFHSIRNWNKKNIKNYMRFISKNYQTKII